MRVKLACTCLAGTFLIIVSSGSVNIQRTAHVPLRASLTETSVASLASLPALERSVAKLAALPTVEKAVDKLASLPGAAESFFQELGAPEIREAETPDTIDAPKDSTLTTLDRARAALAESDALPLSPSELCTRLVDVARANELPLGFFTNLIWQESRFDHEAISPVGAMGIAQFMPDTAERMGLDDAFDGREALPASGKLLRTLADRFGNVGLAAAAYNAGPKRVLDWLAQRAGLPKETRDYVSLITGKPVEQWRGVKDKPVVFTVPRAVPCHRAAHFAAIEHSERIVQQERVAEERRAIEKAREAARRAAQALKRASAKHKKKDKKSPHVITAKHGRSQHVAKL
jgi:soluble lytic murein transglycosylase-like protein